MPSFNSKLLFIIYHIKDPSSLWPRSWWDFKRGERHKNTYILWFWLISWCWWSWWFSHRLIKIDYIGWPVPKVSWWRENALLDDSCEVSSEHVISTVVSNTLTLEKLRRSDLHARLTCQASNSNISIPLSTTVSLEMSCESNFLFSKTFSPDS